MNERNKQENALQSPHRQATMPLQWEVATERLPASIESDCQGKECYKRLITQFQKQRNTKQLSIVMDDQVAIQILDRAFSQILSSYSIHKAVSG